MKKIQKGFTLIELMIVVAIVGILAAIALPAYQDYIARSKTTEVSAALSSFKTSVSEFVSANGQAALASADADAVGITTPQNTKYIASVGFTPSATAPVVSAVIQGINSAIDGDNLILTGTVESDDTIGWTCGSDADTADYKYLPANCRNTATAGTAVGAAPAPAPAPAP
jgi:type IV pilus assembly protein PilA